MCLWDIFSDNHEVFAPDQRVIDLGSFRAMGGFLADMVNRQIGRQEYDYLAFYLGTIWVAQRADLTPVYEMIFRRLKKRRLDWICHFPRLHLVDFRLWKKALAEKDRDPLHYSPEEAFAQEQEDKEYGNHLAELPETIDEGNRGAMAAAREAPPPKSVAAYQNLYGRLPQGWPPLE